MRGRDDRGKRIKLLPHRKLGIIRGLPSPIPLAARQRMYAQGQAVQWSREVLIALLLALVGVCIWGALWVVLTPRIVHWITAPPMVKAVLMGVLPSAPLPFVVYTVIRAGRHRMARIVVRHGYCASCGYHLAGLTPAPPPDGCTICPECGSAWRLTPAPEPESVDRA